MTEIIEIPDFKKDITGDSFHYLGNPHIKRSGVVFPYQKSHVDEIIRCQGDIYYFAEKYFKIIHQDHGIISMQVRPYQKRMIDGFINNRFTISIAPRQIGKSTSFALYVLHYILFNEHKNVAILANKERQAKEILKRIKMAYANLPFWLQQGVKSWNKLEFELENGCKVSAASTSSDSIRGESISLLIIDETAHVPTNIWDDFYESVYPTISSAESSKIILVSTPKGMNHFHRLWKLAEEGRNEFVPCRVKWQEVEHYDEVWKQMTIGNIGPRKFSQEYECSFLASSNSLIPSETIEAMTFLDKIPISELPIYNDVMAISEKLEKYINIYKKPEEGREYVLGVDPAKITEESSGDSLAMQIVDVTDVPFQQVGTIIIPYGIHYLEVPDLLKSLGFYYNEADIFIENNDSIGQEIADSLLYDHEYGNIYREKPGVSGFRTSKKNKKIGCLTLKALLEKEQMTLNDAQTISQLSVFIKTANSYTAEKGYNDDAVMALIHSLVFLQDRMAFEHKRELLTNINIPNSVNPIIPNHRNQGIKNENEMDPAPFGIGPDSDEMQSESIF